MQLTLMSYNIKSGLWTPEGLEAVARVIAAQNPEVVALQEVGRNSPRTGKIDQAMWLGERLGYSAVFCPAIYGDADGLPWEFGNAVLSRRPVVEHECRMLFRPSYPSGQYPDYYAEQRTVLGCTIDLGPSLLDIFCTHFGLTPDQRLIQAREVADFSAGWHPDRPAVLMGDFNAFPDSQEIAIVREVLTDAFQRCGVEGDDRLTFPAGPLGSRCDNGWAGAIDYVFLSPHFTDVRIEAIRESVPASDHAPIVAHVELPTG